MESFRVCRVCHEPKPATEEYYHRDGHLLRATCRDCRDEARKGRHWDNPQTVNGNLRRAMATARWHAARLTRLEQELERRKD